MDVFSDKNVNVIPEEEIVGLLELIQIDILENLLQSFHELTGLTPGLTDEKGKQLVTVGWQPICQFFHRQNNLSLKNCIDSDLYIQNHLSTQSFVEYKCKNGLYDLAYPIILEEQHLGTLFFGQYFHEEENIDTNYFLNQAEAFDFDKVSYLKALEQVPVFSKEKIDGLLFYCKSLANSIISTAQTNLKLKKKEKEESDHRLKEALEYNQKINETSPVGIVVVDKDGQIEFANSRAEETLGLTKSKITSLKYNAPDWKIKDFEGNDFPEEQLPFIRVMNEKESVFNIQHAIEWPDKKVVYLSINASPKFNEQDQFEGMIATIEDVSERVISERQLKEVSSFREMIIKNAAEGLCVCHNCEDFPFVRFTVWNNQIEKITGYTIEEINELGWYQSLYKDLEIREKAITRMSSMREGDDIIGEEWEVSTKDNKTKTISISTSIIHTDKGVTHVMALITDITEKKKQRESINKHNDELKLLNKTKDRFLSILSHDLKGPMGTQIELLTVILEDYNKYSKEKLQNFIQLLLDNGKSSFYLLENILNWARVQIGNDSSKPERFQIKDIIEEAMDLYKTLLDNKRIHLDLKIEENLLLFTDINIIRTVVRNLLSNSIKFTNEGGQIIISASTLENGAVVSVKDNGVGMSDEIKSTLFKEGETQSAYGTKDETGTGLGLLICKELLLSVKGDIWVESVEGEGSCFYFSVPSV